MTLPFRKAAGLVAIGISADAVATAEGFSRADCDAFAAESQARAARRGPRGALSLAGAGGRSDCGRNPARRNHSRKALSALSPAFAEMGEKYGMDAAIMAHYRAGACGACAPRGQFTGDGGRGLGRAGRDRGGSAARGLRPRARILAVAELAVDRVLALTGSVDAANARWRARGWASATSTCSK